MVREVNIPKSINLEFEDFCEDCPYIELSGLDYKLHKNALYLGHVYTIACEHIGSCRRIYDLMKGAAK